MQTQTQNPTNEFLKKCINLASAFEKLHNMRSDDLTDEEFDVDMILPYLVLHARDNRSIFAKLSHFRVSNMISISKSQIEEVDNNFAENLTNLDALSDGQKLWCFRKDLERCENNEPCKYFCLSLFSHYLSGIFPFIYNRFMDDFSLTAFVRAVMCINDNAIISTCIAFPQFIIPIFNQTFDGNLKAELAVLSPALREVLIPKLMIEPSIQCGLIAHFIKDRSPEYLLLTLGCNFNGVSSTIQEFIKSSYNSKAFYLCIARHCACKMAVTEDEVDRLLRCDDPKLLAALFFYVRQIPGSKIQQIFDRFMKDKESFIQLMLFYSEISYKNFYLVTQWTQKYLGESFTSVGSNLLSTEINSRQSQIVSNFQAYAIDHPKLLKFIGATMTNSSDIFIDFMASALYSLETVTYFDYDVLGRFVKLFPAQDQIVDVIAAILKEKPFFDVESIRKNPAPATAASLLIFLISKNKSKKLLQMVPIRLLMAACSEYEVFYHYCQGVKYLFEIADDEPFMSLKMSDIKPKMSKNEVFQLIKNDPIKITKEILEEWRVHHFINSFNFITQTLEALGAPLKHSNLQFVFDFDIHLLSNINALKMLLTCTIDLIYVDEKVTKEAVILLLHESIDHLADSRIDRPTLGWFIGTLLRKTKFIHALIDTGIKKNVINEFSQYVKMTDLIAEEMIKAGENISIGNVCKVTTVARAFCNNAGVKITPVAKTICNRMQKVLFRNDSDINIFKEEKILSLLEDLSCIAIAVPSLHTKILELIRSIQIKFERIVSDEANAQILALKNKMTSSLFNIE